MHCPNCNSLNVQKRGIKHNKQRFQCNTCRKYFKSWEDVEKVTKTPAKVLLFDIETLPMEFYGWGLWNMITSPEFIIRDWCVLGYAAKWLFEPEVMTSILTPKEALDHNDENMVNEIWRLFDQADVVISHNGLSFDLSRMNTRFIFYGLNPPSHYLNIDTLLTSRKAFGFSSNALDYLGEYLGLGRKNKTDFEWWRECAKGNQEYLTKMNTYNVRDITLLEDVYVKLRPYIKHPNMALFMDAGEIQVCPRCTSPDIKWEGEYHTEASTFDAFRCNNCGGIGRSKKKKFSSVTRATQSI